MKKKILAVLLAGFILLSAAGCDRNTGSEDSGDTGESGSSDSGEAAEQPQEEGAASMPLNLAEVPQVEGAVATFEEYEIPADLYAYYFYYFKSQMVNGALNGGYTADQLGEFWKLEEEGDIAADYLREQVMSSAKQHAILLKWAEDYGTTVTEEMDAQGDEMVDSLLETGGGDEEQFFQTYGTTPDTMKKIYHEINVVDTYTMDYYNAIEVPEEDVKALYDEAPESYDNVTVQHILVSDKAKADELLKQIEDGTPIGDLVADNTEDTASIETKGEYTFAKGDMVPEFEAWAFAAETGDKGVVQSDYGYHVMEMVGREESTFEDAKARIEETLRNTLMNEKIAETEPIKAGAWELDDEKLAQFKVEGQE